MSPLQSKNLNIGPLSNVHSGVWRVSVIIRLIGGVRMLGAAEVPSAPFDVRLVSCSARVVQLEWRHVINDSVTMRQLQFVIEYNTSFHAHTWHVSHVARAHVQR